MKFNKEDLRRIYRAIDLAVAELRTQRATCPDVFEHADEIAEIEREISGYLVFKNTINARHPGGGVLENKNEMPDVVNVWREDPPSPTTEPNTSMASAPVSDSPNDAPFEVGGTCGHPWGLSRIIAFDSAGSPWFQRLSDMVVHHSNVLDLDRVMVNYKPPVRVPAWWNASHNVVTNASSHLPIYSGEWTYGYWTPKVVP